MGITLDNGSSGIESSGSRRQAYRGRGEGDSEFLPAVIKPDCESFIRNVDITAELRILSAQVRVRGENL